MSKIKEFFCRVAMADDIKDIDEVDLDMISGDLKDHFKEEYCLKECKAVTLEDDVYVLHLSVNGQGKILSGMSNKSFNIHDVGLNKLKTEHMDDHVIDAKFSPVHPDLFYIGTNQCIHLWDSRTDSSEATYDFKSIENKAPKPLISFDINCQDKYLSAGTEVINHDAFVVFWDIRGKHFLGGYWETLGDDVNVSQFSKKDPNQLMTASADGQVNLFDISQDNEEDALVTSLNTEAPIRSLTYLQDDKVAVVLDHEESLLWKTYEGQPYRTFSREDFTVAIRRKITPWTYVCGVHHDQEANKTFVLSGSSYAANPCLRVLNISKTKLKPFADLHSLSKKPARNMIMRSSAMFQSQIFITGSEDGLISIWAPGKQNLNEEEVEKEKTSKSSNKKPYQRPS